jgi:sugar phosphate permease
MTTRWKVFTALAAMFSVGFFYRVSMAVSADAISKDLGLSAAQLGVLSGIFFYAFAVMQIPLGPLLDRFGGRRIITLLGLVTTCGSMFFAMAINYHMALAGRMLLGMGTACVLMGSFKIFTNWFTRQEFTAVSGYMVAAGNLGNLTATAPLAQALSRFGWRQTFLAVSLLQVVITLIVYVVVCDAPRQMVKPPEAASLGDPGLLQTWRLIIATRQFWLISLLAFFWYANYMVLLALWGGPYLMDAIGLTNSQSGTMLFCISIGFIAGSLSVGNMVTRLFGSLKTTIIFGQTLLLFGMLAMLGPAESFSKPMLACLFFIIGLAASTGVIIYPLAREIVPHRFVATAMTCVNFFLLMGAAVTQHIMGMYIGSFAQTAHGYPAAAYHGAFLIPICGLTGTLVLCAFLINSSSVSKRGKV